jgi:hypothetical protein
MNHIHDENCNCVDRIIKGDHKEKAARIAFESDPANLHIPPAQPTMGRSSIEVPQKMALLAGKRHRQHSVLKVHFVDGSRKQHEQVQRFASLWSWYCNIQFDFGVERSISDLRIAFDPQNGGSWSYIGTDNLAIARNETTMNFGWCVDNTPDDEWERVVVHEFGHALGCIHEHQNPEGGIQWDEAAVYAYYRGAPNYWSDDDIRNNVLKKYSVSQLNASTFDPLSIMLYPFSSNLVKNRQGTRGNGKLSAGDIAFISAQYPKGA